jgi:APA family basic amino acid/polyamine antiporter
VNPPASLSRELGLFWVTLSGIGVILGAGIYVLIGVAAGSAGNAVWLSFLLAAGIALLTCLSYAELSAMVPRAGAEFEYASGAFGRGMGFVTGWLVYLSGVIGSATVAIGFGRYFQALTGLDPALTAVVLAVVVSVVLFFGIRASAWVAGAFTLVEIAGLLLIIAAGLPRLGSVDYFAAPLGAAGILGGAALVFFAYQGFEGIVKLAEETRDPELTIPRALILSIAVSVVLYVLVAISAVSVIGWDTLARSGAPFQDVAGQAFGPSAGALLEVIALFSTANTVLLALLGTSRICYGMADSGAFPHPLSYIHPGTRTPWIAIGITGTFTAALAWGGDISFVAGVTNYTLFVAFAVVNASVIALRFRSPAAGRPFRIPFSIRSVPIPAAGGLIFCLLMLVALEPDVQVAGTLLLAAGIAAAFIRRRHRGR